MKLLWILSLSFVLWNCGQKQEDAAGEGAPMDEKCRYAYQEDSTSLTWTSYKFTEKVGVPGSFDSIKVLGFKESEDPVEVVNQIAFEINTQSVNTGDPVRDPKIVKSYFGKMKDGQTIKGFVKSLNPDGTGEIAMDMNGIQANLPVTYKVEGEAVTITGVMDTETWDMGVPLKSLNKVCELLHKGEDGKSVLWPEVKIEIRTVLEKDCG